MSGKRRFSLFCSVLLMMAFVSASAADYDMNTLRGVQEALNNAGYDFNITDERNVNSMQTVISQYQDEHGLKVNGLITDSVLSSLEDPNGFDVNDADTDFGIPADIFVDRYNEAVDDFNALYADPNGYERISAITQEEVESAASFTPDSRFTITLSASAQDEMNIEEFSASMEEEDLIVDMSALGEATALIYALDVNLADFQEAADLYDVVVSYYETDYNDITYIFETTDGLTLTGTRTAPPEIEEDEYAGAWEGTRENDYGSSAEELSNIFADKMKELISDDNITVDVEEDGAGNFNVSYNNGALQIGLSFDMTDSAYIIQALPSGSLTYTRRADYYDFLTYLIQTSDEELTEVQAYNILMHVLNDGEAYMYHGNYYEMGTSLFSVQIIR